MKEKRCYRCKTDKFLGEFYKDRGKRDGLMYMCKVCKKKHDIAYNQTSSGKVARKKALDNYNHSEKGMAANRRGVLRYSHTKKGTNARNRYRQTEKYRIANAKATRYFNAKYPEHAKARNAVSNAIKAGRLPRPDTLQCSCGKQAQEYHHSNYISKHWFDVEPMCMKCHKHLHRKYKETA